MTDQEKLVKARIDSLFDSSRDAVGDERAAYIKTAESVAAYFVFYNGALKLEGAECVRWYMEFVPFEAMVDNTRVAVMKAFPNHRLQELIWRCDPEVVTGKGPVVMTEGPDGPWACDGDRIRIRITALPPYENAGD